MSEFSNNWDGVETSDAIAENHHFKYLILGGGNSAGYAAKHFVEYLSSPNPLQLDLNKIKNSPLRTGSKAGNQNLLAIIGAESVVPYERPALSKAYLNPPGSKVQLRHPNFNTCVGTSQGNQSESWYKQNNITLFLSHEAVEVDCEKQVILCDRRSDRKLIAITYDKLIVATGARPLFTNMFDRTEILNNIFVLRNETDAASLVKGLELQKGKKMLIIGGGYIGLECAAALAGWDLDVTMVFPEDKLLSRIFTDEISSWYEKYMTEVKGIKLLKNTKVKTFIGAEGKVAKAELDTGGSLDCDMVIIGIGAVLNLDIFNDQLFFGNQAVKGLQVDSNLLTSDPNILAIGDIAAVPFKRTHRRFEHVDHCRQTAKIAMANALIDSHNLLTGEQKPLLIHEYLPFYYSRLFEYTDTPVVFNFYGYTGDDMEGVTLVQFGEYSSLAVQPKCALWVDKNARVIGGLLCCANPDAYAELKNAVTKKLIIKSFDAAGAKQLFKSLK